MKPYRMKRIGMAVLAFSMMTLICSPAVWGARPDNPGGGGGRPGGEAAGNNLSFPVIWAEGVTKALPGTALMTPLLNGVWWYWWGTEGTDPNIVPLSCAPDPDNEAYCDDGVAGQYDINNVPGDGWEKAYLQKDINNVWQAENEDWSTSQVVVDWIDWGDNLESQDWYLTSQVRTEVVLLKDLPDNMQAYEMLHVSGWGIDEVHGLAVSQEDVPRIYYSTQATIYSPCARLTIQKLQVERDSEALTGLIWAPKTGWTDPDGGFGTLVNAPIFNSAVYEGGDGPGYYSAEINVKGKIIYGYTWNVRRTNDGAGDYRITFSLDPAYGSGDDQLLNTGIDDTTQILLPVEEAVVVIAEEDGGSSGGGATAMLDTLNNLTYTDVRILQRGGGGGGQGGGQGGRR